MLRERFLKLFVRKTLLLEAPREAGCTPKTFQKLIENIIA
jgi:hypothetical protein